MPAAIFILMAAEAARQIFVAQELIAGSIEIFRLSFHGPLSLSLFDTAPSLELHLIARLTEQTNHFSFDILYLIGGKKDISQRICSGSFRWADALTKRVVDKSQPFDCDHDPWLLEHSHTLGYEFSSDIFDLKMSSMKSSGRFEYLSEPFDHLWVDPCTLQSVLDLASTSNFQYGPLSVQQIASIASLTFTLTPTTKQKNGHFTTEVQSQSSNMTNVNIDLCFDEHCVMSLADVCFAKDKFIEQAPASQSLFFHPVILADITRLGPSAKPMDLSECLRLATHKWPMCDMGITGLMDQDTKTVLDSERLLVEAGLIFDQSLSFVMPESNNLQARFGMLTSLKITIDFTYCSKGLT